MGCSVIIQDNLADCCGKQDFNGGLFATKQKMRNQCQETGISKYKPRATFYSLFKFNLNLLVKTKYYIAMLVATAGFYTVALSGLAADDFKTYSVPKGHPPIPQTIAATPAATEVEINAAPIHWTTPIGWKELLATSVRIGNFLIPGEGDKKAEVAITSFPGTVGTELDNVNRWRREIGLEAVDQSGISSQVVTVDSQEGKLYDFAGASANTVVVSLPREGATWFFKLRGDKDIVDGAKVSFLDFLKSVHFSRDAALKTAATSEAVPSDPHAGVISAVDNSNSEPNWNPPSTWHANQPGPMVVKSFSVPVDNGQKASVAISVFPGDVGGALANVNRWRTQMGLAPIEQGDLPNATQSVRVAGGEAVLVDLANPNAPAGRPTRLVAAIVPHNGSTWFYKLVGDDSVVAREKEGFVKFVQTVRYP
jgi:hypothetical protein